MLFSKKLSQPVLGNGSAFFFVAVCCLTTLQKKLSLMLLLLLLSLGKFFDGDLRAPIFALPCFKLIVVLWAFANLSRRLNKCIFM